MDVLNGELKQQCLDETGLFEWIRKRFSLKISSGILEIYQLSESQPHNLSAHITISGARYAKEWSISSAIAGFGFDIIWSSGKMWSFLADDESACNLWVRCINESIRLSAQSLSRSIDKSLLKSHEDFKALIGVKKTNIDITSNESLSTAGDFQSPIRLLNTHTFEGKENKQVTTVSKFDSNRNEIKHRNSLSKGINLNISDIPKISVSGSSAGTVDGSPDGLGSSPSQQSESSDESANYENRLMEISKSNHNHHLLKKQMKHYDDDRNHDDRVKSSSLMVEIEAMRLRYLL